MTKKTISFTETGSGYRYANYATIDDVQFPQVEKKKKRDKPKTKTCLFREREKVKKKRKSQVQDELSQLYLTWTKKHSIQNLPVE